VKVVLLQVGPKWSGLRQHVHDVQQSRHAPAAEPA
jgi:hypothetical protein